LPLSFLSSPVNLNPAALSATHQCVDPHRAQTLQYPQKKQETEADIDTCRIYSAVKSIPAAVKAGGAISNTIKHDHPWHSSRYAKPSRCSPSGE
jgi:hypothetical protein